MTLEHLPPRSSDNAGSMRQQNDAGEIIREFTEGHALPVLCRGCNGGASERGLPNAYKLWRLEVIKAIEDHTARESKGRPYNVWRTDPPVEIGHGYNLHPGRIARQLLGMLLAVQDRPDFSTAKPALREAYFSDEGSSIAPARVYVALANTNYGYFSDAVSAVNLDLVTGAATTTPMRLWSFSPFIAILTADGSDPPFPALSVEEWFAHPGSYHFHKADRHASYPIAPRFHPLVALMYGDSQY